jgi:energy-coupling factor transporter ATP-binding protein EcfA2
MQDPRALRDPAPLTPRPSKSEHYDWPRFLVAPDGAIDLDSNGFLRNPTGGLGAFSNPHLVQPRDLLGLPALVVLGEPGIGKSTLLSELEGLAEAQDRKPIRIDLETSGSEERLHQRLTVPAIIHAGTSAPPADLLIDGFDTGLLSVPTLGGLLAEVFGDYPRDADLRIRIACRSAVWPQSLQQALKDKWGEDRVEIVEMAPLRRCDAALAAQQEGLDPDSFLRQIEEHHAGVLAARPVTLRFLLNIARQQRPFPPTRVELFRQGCELLCAEDNPARLESGRRGNREPSERMMIAARIAAVLLICNRESVWRGPHHELDSTRDCSVNDLVGPMLSADGSLLQLTQQDISETLDTGLFWLYGPQRSHFVHQTYAEFLAAWYLAHQRLSTPRRLELLTDAATGGLIPQLHEVAAWSAGLDSALFQSLLTVHAPVLLTSDVARAVPELKAGVIDGVLALAANGQWTDNQWGIRRFYAQLRHPDIAAQLRPWIEDRDRFVLARGIAIDIAVACGLSELQDVMADVALDPGDEPQIRGDAIDALTKFGDRPHREMLLPLLALTPEEDPSDELRGDAMRALWPDCIDSRSLLRHIGPRSNPSHMGSYWRFVTEELPNSLQERDLAIALRWACDQVADSQPCDDNRRIAQAFVAPGLDFLASPDASRQPTEPLQELANLLLRLRAQAEMFLPISSTRRANHPLRNKTHRHRLLPFLLRRVNNLERSAYLLVWSLHDDPAFVQPEDVPWLLQLASTAASPTTCWTLCRLIWHARKPRQDREVYDACMEHPVMRRALPELTGTIWLSSQRAQREREQINARRTSAETLQAPPLDPSPQQRIAATLERIEAGDLDAFVQFAIDDLVLMDDGRYERSRSVDLREFNGWQQANEAIRARIVAAAFAYLTKADPPLDKLLEIGGSTYRTDSVIRALFLIDHEAADTAGGIMPAIWKRWAPVFLPRFVHVADDEKKWGDELLKRAYEAAPTAIQDAIRRYLDRDLEVGDWEHTTMGLDPIWDDVIGATILRVAKAARATHRIFESVFGALMRNARDLALPHGLHIVAALPEPATEAERKNAVLVANLAVKTQPQCAWPVVWQAIQRDLAFGRSLMLKLALNWGNDAGWWRDLDDDQLGQLAFWVEQSFARELGQQTPQSGLTLQTPDRDWDLDRLKSGVLGTLVERGTPESVGAVERIAAAHADSPWSRRLKAQAYESLRRTSWRPPSPAELLLVTGDGQKRLVRDGAELLNLVVESLGRLQERLTTGWNPLVRCLWDECKLKKPKDENFLSDFICDHLNGDLRGVAAQREVEARNRLGKGVGERTDILVTATATAHLGHAESIAVVIECKGCWNRDLQTAIKEQLKQRYLIDEGHRLGIYLVGWFLCEAWDAKDHRRRGVPKNWTLEGAIRTFREQAEELSDSRCVIRSIVLDLRLPTAIGNDSINVTRERPRHSQKLE